MRGAELALPATRFEPTFPPDSFLRCPKATMVESYLIEDTYGNQTVKLAAGDMILYLANGLYRVNFVTRGPRLACFFWMQGMVRDDGQRTFLFDLDATIQQLTARMSLHAQDLPACTITCCGGGQRLGAHRQH